MEPIRSDSYDGKMRWLWPVMCSVCGRSFFLPKNRLRDRNTCSRKCRAEKRREVRVDLTCAMCGRAFDRQPSNLKNSRSGLTFCTRKCKDEAQRVGLKQVSEIQPAHYGNGEHSYRERALRAHGSACARCGYHEDERMLDAHHLRGRATHMEEDLEVLCVWCHALETRKVVPHSWVGVIGAVAQLGERCIRIAEVAGSIPASSTEEVRQ